MNLSRRLITLATKQLFIMLLKEYQVNNLEKKKKKKKAGHRPPSHSTPWTKASCKGGDL